MKRITIVLLALIVLVTGFIFSNSLKNGEESTQISNMVLEWLRPVLEWVFRGTEVSLSYFLRKAAHLTEFCVLGICTFGFTRHRRKKSGRDLTGFAFFYVMLIAVLDEFIQSFTGRTSMVQDVLLDFCGALLGMAIVFAAEWVWNSVKKRKST